MSRRPLSAGIQRPPSRAPSISRLSRATSSNSVARHAADAPLSPTARRRRLSTAANAAGSVRMPTQASETNINVVVRCRGRSEPELAEGSPAIVTTDGPLSKAITIETSPMAAASAANSAFTTASSYAGGGQHNTRKYAFDKVFGPEADNNMIFNEVAEKMLDEVLAGYNCTIFAYGQTGTGKTYTMQGDTTPTALMRPSHDAGIIPRVLHKLFSHLEAQEGAEYAVKCSYIELYNEELRDLLAPEYKDSTGSAIKIFEDSSKKGVHVQGVEEAGLRDLKDGLAALAKGTNRRQTAETKMNSESSRSHSIFTLTVHVRESGVDKGDEDLLRIGKFNLVDLAGSEAIGRSGAENKRAREAGMINQSLLTLGRVISALVDKGSHIPYRESKLTRLLQDSLGGRTKTCIIATVSPTKSNMEETISTLDYALRAKSIKNKPELNAHLTKAGLLKEYVADIERLKAELWATREKNGIYIPEDIYREMQTTQTRQKTDHDNARQRVATIEVELKSRKTEFDILSQRFVTTTDELVVIRESERQLTEMVEQAKVDVETMRLALGEERVVAEAFEAGEERLHAVASELKGVAADSVRDVGGLHAKVGRLNDVLDSNTDGAARFGSEMQALSADLKDGIEEIYVVQAGFADVIKQDLEAFAQRGREESKAHLGELDAAFGKFGALATALEKSLAEGKVDGAAVAAEIAVTKADMQATLRAGFESVATRCTQMGEDLLAHQEEHLDVVGGVLDTSMRLLDTITGAARENVRTQTMTLENAKTLAADAANAEIARLRAQNDLVSRLLSEEQAKTEALRTDLINKITSLVTGFTDAQDASLRSAINKAKVANDTGIEKMGAFVTEHTRTVDTGLQGAAAFGTDLSGHAAAIERQRGEGDKALGQVAAGMRDQLGLYAEQTTTQADEHVQQVDAFCGRLGTAASKLSTGTARRAEAQSSTLGSLSRSAADGHERAAKRTKTDAAEVARLTSTLLSSHAESSRTAAEAHTAAQDRMAEIENSTARFLSGIAIDEPTGTTPRKRSYPIPNWQRTQPRQLLIDSMRRGRPIPSASSSTSVPSRPPSALASASASRLHSALSLGDSVGSSATGPRLSSGTTASGLSDSTIYSPPSAAVDLHRVSSSGSVSSLKSEREREQGSLNWSTGTGGSAASAPNIPIPTATLVAPVRQMSASTGIGFGGGPMVSLKRMALPLARKHSRDGERLGAVDRERERGVGMSLLGDGGNVPRGLPRRR